MTVNRKTKLFVAVTLLALALSMALSIVPALANGCDPCCRSPGYYKKEAHWPEGVYGVTIGGVWYDKEDAIDWLNKPVQNDKTITLFKALVASKLNRDYGCCNVGCTISAADDWMAAHPVGSGVEASSCAWQCEGEPIYLVLDAFYNNGD